jgi:hypothetical protein
MIIGAIRHKVDRILKKGLSKAMAGRGKTRSTRVVRIGRLRQLDVTPGFGWRPG